MLKQLAILRIFCDNIAYERRREFSGFHFGNNYVKNRIHVLRVDVIDNVLDGGSGNTYG